LLENALELFCFALIKEFYDHLRESLKFDEQVLLSFHLVEIAFGALEGVEEVRVGSIGDFHDDELLR